jgi:thiamine biosynthesis lipoprotein ApbE
VSVRAEACWLAEIWAKAVVIGGEEARARVERAGLLVLAVTADGTINRSSNW